jgi:hypothetical protein
MRHNLSRGQQCDVPVSDALLHHAVLQYYVELHGCPRRSADIHEQLPELLYWLVVLKHDML